MRTLCLMCLLGDNAVSVLKTMGVRVAEKAASKAINSIPTAVLVRLNKAVGTTLVVKCGKVLRSKHGTHVPCLREHVNQPKRTG